LDIPCWILDIEKNGVFGCHFFEFMKLWISVVATSMPKGEYHGIPNEDSANCSGKGQSMVCELSERSGRSDELQEERNH